MRLNRLAAALLHAGVISPMPAGMTADKAAAFSLTALISNVNNYSQAVSSIATSGTNVNLTAAQALIGVTRLTSGASGGFTITLPSTAALLAALGPTIPIDGTFAMPISMMNDNVGQTGTLTAGDASTTINGTATVATNTRRVFMLTVNAGGASITIQNIGSMGL